MKAKKNQDVLLRVAQAVADGTRVDWDQEATAGGDLGKTLQNLHALERIKTVHESQPDPGADTAGAKDVTQLLPTDQEAARNWGHLEIKERIGKGSFGEVYRAHDPALKVDVALKLYLPQIWEDPEDEETYLEEARKLAQIRNQNVLLIYGADRREGQVGIWTELVEGQSLQKVLEDQGAFGPREATLIGIDLCKALAAVHAQGLVHGDVKPSNIMREKGGRIVLTDFGGARHYDPQKKPDQISGTPLYMAPELYERKDSGHASDIYSLGVLLYELVTQRHPVFGRNQREMRDKHRRKETVPLRDVRPDLPTCFIQAVELALAPDPEDRMSSAGEMEHALQSCLGMVASRKEASKSKGWSKTAGQLALAAAAVGIVAFALWRAFLVPLEVETSIFRLGQGVEERLVEGGRIRPGDQLFLEIEATKKMYVYIMNEDQAGDAYRLFPLQDLDTQNPLPGGTVHRLPGTVGASPRYWDVTSTGGTETILVVASRKRLEEVESKFESLSQAGTGGALRRQSQELLGELRGIGGLSPLAQRDQSSSISDITGALNVTSSNNSGVWIWEITLVNPSP